VLPLQLTAEVWQGIYSTCKFRNVVLTLIAKSKNSVFDNQLQVSSPQPRDHKFNHHAFFGLTWNGIMTDSLVRQSIGYILENSTVQMVNRYHYRLATCIGFLNDTEPHFKRDTAVRLLWDYFSNHFTFIIWCLPNGTK